MTPPDLVVSGTGVTAEESGYVQGIDFDDLVDLAHQHDLLVTMRVRPGAHVITGTTLAVVVPPGRLSEEVQVAVRRSVRLGRARNPQQDVAFPALLLEEMSVRALSPGTNDPYTAINALDNLADGLATLASRPMPSSFRCDQDGRRRVIAPAISLLDIVGHLVDAMRFYALEHPPVLHRVLELLTQVGSSCPETRTREAMVTYAVRLVSAFAATSPQDADLEALTSHTDRVRHRLLIAPEHA